MGKTQLCSQGACGLLVTYSQLVGGRARVITWGLQTPGTMFFALPKLSCGPQVNIKHSQAIYIPHFDTPFSVSEISLIDGMKQLIF